MDGDYQCVSFHFPFNMLRICEYLYKKLNIASEVLSCSRCFGLYIESAVRINGFRIYDILINRVFVSLRERKKRKKIISKHGSNNNRCTFYSSTYLGL